MFLFGDEHSAMNNIKLSVLMFALVTDRIKYNLHSLIRFWALRDYDLAVMLLSSKINSKRCLKADIFSFSAVWWLPTEVMRGLESTTVAGTTTCKPNIVYTVCVWEVRLGVGFESNTASKLKSLSGKKLLLYSSARLVTWHRTRALPRRAGTRQNAALSMSHFSNMMSQLIFLNEHQADFCLNIAVYRWKMLIHTIRHIKLTPFTKMAVQWWY